MAAQYWGNMSIVVGELEVAGHATNFLLEGARRSLPRTTLNTTGWEANGKGLRSQQFSIDFLQDLDAGSVDDTFWDHLEAESVPKSIVKDQATDGSLAYLMNSVGVQYVPFTGAVGDNVMGRLGVASTGPMARGVVLHPGQTARSSSSSGTGRQLGAVAAGHRLFAHLAVHSVSGSSTPTLTVKVQSDDNSGFTSATDRITFTDVTDVTTANYRWSSVVGAITDDYWRVVWTISGSTPSFLFTVTAGIY